MEDSYADMVRKTEGYKTDKANKYKEVSKNRLLKISKKKIRKLLKRFGTDFATNKQSLNEISIVRSKGLKNKIAGYITKILQRKAKFDERKQMLIDNEKKSQERKQSRSKKSDVLPALLRGHP